MEDKGALITVKTKIKEEILEDQSTETDRFGVYEEHNYINNKSDHDYNYSQLHHSINIKEENDYHIETEYSYSNEPASNASDVQTQDIILTATNYCDSRQQIKAEKCAFNLKTLEKDKAMGTENFDCSATFLTEQNQFINIIKKEVPTKSSRKQQIFKKEHFDCELAELHHSITIKEEIEFMETDNAVEDEDDYNSDTVRPFLGSQYYPTINNNKHSRNNTQGDSKTRAQTNEARWGQNAEDIVDDPMETPKDERMVPKSTVDGLNSRRRAFESFCEARKLEITETTPVKEIARVLKDYAFNMRRQDGSDYKESTLKTHWNSTARDLQNRFYQEYGIKFDPFKDVEFVEARRARDSKRKILQGDPKKRLESCTAFTIKEHCQMVKAYDESTPEGLSRKFFLVASKELEWYSNEAVRALTDYFVEEVTNDGTCSLRYNPDIPHSKRIVEDKWLISNDNEEMCPVRLYKKMLSKRPKGAPNRVFLNADPHWRLNKSSWYVKSPVGKNTLGTWTKEAAEKIGVKGKRFAKHSTKSTVVTNLTDSKIPGVTENRADNNDKSHQNLIGTMQTGPSGSGNVRDEILRNVNLQRNVNIQQYINSVDPPPLVYII